MKTEKYESPEQIEQIETSLKIAYWDHREGCENLSTDNFDEAVELALSGEIAEGDTLTLNGYARMKPGLSGDTILEELSTGVLCELFSENGDPEMPAEAVDLANKLAECINTKWEPWACEIVVEVVIDLCKWKESNTDAEK